MCSCVVFDCNFLTSDIGCAHAQQLIWQLFNAVEKGFTESGDTDVAFLSGECESINFKGTLILEHFISELRMKREMMDKGLKVGSWGQLQGCFEVLNFYLHGC